jgi:hypothetical protein
MNASTSYQDVLCREPFFLKPDKIASGEVLSNKLIMRT